MLFGICKCSPTIIIVVKLPYCWPSQKEVVQARTVYHIWWQQWDHRSKDSDTHGKVNETEDSSVDQGMMTRSGRVYKSGTMDDLGRSLHEAAEIEMLREETGLGSRSVSGEFEVAGQIHALGSMAEAFKLLKEMEDQRLRAAERREQAAEEARRHQAEEHARNLMFMQQQVETLKDLVERDRSRPLDRTGESVQRSSGADAMRQVRLTEADDIEAYLTTFEWMMEMEGAEVPDHL